MRAWLERFGAAAFERGANECMLMGPRGGLVGACVRRPVLMRVPWAVTHC
jgi:hypothetical protein